MPKLFLLIAFLMLANGAFAQKTNKPKQVNFDLTEALQQKLVTLTITGTGGHQGESVKLVCKNLRGQFLRLRIPQGQLLEPVETEKQTLVVSEEKTLAVNTKAPVEVMLSTYCTQAGDLSPTSGSVFALGAMAPTALCSLLKFIANQHKAGTGADQSAVWCLTGGGGLGSIGDPELTKFTADLLGKAVPGYQIRHQLVREVPGQRAALGKALVIEGNYNYTLEKEEKLQMVLLDGQKKFIKNIAKEETMTAGEHRSGLRLEVYNLPPGSYTVRVQTRDGRVIKDIAVEF